mmetsp:Transcript_18849/g.32195  ORF Transcript_18849/g.32195 Transcript_18849/m.32195 type:complete len:405 (-) Transcript_18849:699-1913(-)|eukprot:CAMPEP_0119107366 /NCGR_PEP_ID=MMETSP1180-20130426/9664_1 /TAXON_ID=3052 ORGANISM="Chlamydomonas cf sp, Strain CCMP681" /NCGR_SAMPLE_ID=MMETSP1180 /ASSEMBLY_ACC=CAM_ASM_000741 /LENGTH=404 /DNA_ID=CAMNT_0007092841 /DNA_START=57 /DNA_END=1271 /DNA_ORIENTATION=+
MAGYNARNPAVRRILQEIKEVQEDTSGDFMAEALESDIFEWHFAVRGPPDTDFQGGIYHGRILLPAEYPFKPPAFMMLTQSGRFETNMKICLSISMHHPEHWQPSWSIRTALMALIAFMPTPGQGALGSLDWKPEERHRLALKSQQEAPKFGSPERQVMIDDMHARMVASSKPMASGSESPCAPVAEASISIPAAPTAADCVAPPPSPVPAASPAAAGPSEAHEPAPAQRSTAGTAVPVLAPSQQQTAQHATPGVVHAALPALPPAPTVPTPAVGGAGSGSSAHSTHGSACQCVPPGSMAASSVAGAGAVAGQGGEQAGLRSRFVAAGSGGVPPQPPSVVAGGTAAATLPVMQNRPDNAVQQVAPSSSDTWLTATAMFLVVAIAAILLRKVLGIPLPDLASTAQ